MILPAFSRRFAIMLMASSQSVFLIAQEAAPQEAGQTASAVAPLRIPEVKLVEGAERTIMLADGTKIKVPTDLWKPSQLLNTSHGPVQLPAKLAPSNQAQQERKTVDAGRGSAGSPDIKPSRPSDGPPPKSERQRYRFDLPEPGKENQRPQPTTSVPKAVSKSATAWKPQGIISMRNQLQFIPAPDGTLRTNRNANIRGDNGEMAASSQTRVMRSIQGMPEYLRVYFDPKVNGFYIDVVRPER